MHYAWAAHSFSAGIKYRHCTVKPTPRDHLSTETIPFHGGLASGGNSLAGWLGRHTSVWCCEGMFLVRLQHKDPLELTVRRMELHLSSEFLSPHDITKAVESDLTLLMLVAYLANTR